MVGHLIVGQTLAHTTPTVAADLSWSSVRSIVSEVSGSCGSTVSVGCSHQTEGAVDASPAVVGLDEGRGETRPLDATAFGQGFQQTRDGIFRYLRARCQTDDEAADLTAATFERAWRSRDRFRATPAGTRRGCIRSPDGSRSTPRGSPAGVLQGFRV